MANIRSYLLQAVTTKVPIDQICQIFLPCFIVNFEQSSLFLPVICLEAFQCFNTCYQVTYYQVLKQTLIENNDRYWPSVFTADSEQVFAHKISFYK